jgi:hypothetical protein
MKRSNRSHASGTNSISCLGDFAMSKIQRVKLDPHQMYLHAWQFMTASELVNSKENGAAYWQAAELGNPCIVLSAFASEIMLKTLITLEGATFGDTHRLDKLFKIVSNSNRKKLSDRWDSRLKSGIGNLFDAIEKDTNIPIPRDLPSVLKGSSDSFRLVRYIYEGHTITFHIWEFPRMVSELILESKPGWNAYDKTKARQPILAILPEDLRLRG